MDKKQPLQGLHQVQCQCYWLVAVEVFGVCGLWHQYNTGGLQQLWRSPQLQA